MAKTDLHGIIRRKNEPTDADTPPGIPYALHVAAGQDRHLHVAQDEWFYVLEGQFLIEVGAERFRLQSGDAVLAPRGVPHVWANVGDGTGRLLGVLNPAGKAEAFFRYLAKNASLAPPDPALFRLYDTEWVGPPLPIEP